MKKFKVLTLNSISVVGLERLPRDRYEVASEIPNPDAIMLRSSKMHDMVIPDTLKAVARAGAGVNNIPVEKLTGLGIPVFNAPGANANAVKELVLVGILMAARNIVPALDFARRLEGDDATLNKRVESGKKDFVGFELPGRTLGVIGLGAIGVKVANAALALGMKVIGYDPALTVQSAWKLSSDVQRANTVDELIARSDVVTLHIPEVESTRGLINGQRIGNMRKGAVLVNFARPGIVDSVALRDGLNSGRLHGYVCDFPSNALKDSARVIALPHLGASTVEAEDNCAVMVADQLRDFLETGNIVNSVNFPEVVMPQSDGHRIAIANSNVPNMVGQISTAMANAGLNIIDMINKSKGDVAYTMADVDKCIPSAVVERIREINGVLSVRVLG
jgi:D-3-phosphoglycerate dehydrogenase